MGTNRRGFLAAISAVLAVFTMRRAPAPQIADQTLPYRSMHAGLRTFKVRYGWKQYARFGNLQIGDKILVWVTEENRICEATVVEMSFEGVSVEVVAVQHFAANKVDL